MSSNLWRHWPPGCLCIGELRRLSDWVTMPPLRRRAGRRDRASWATWITTLQKGCGGSVVGGRTFGWRMRRMCGSPVSSRMALLVAVWWFHAVSPVVFACFPRIGHGRQHPDTKSSSGVVVDRPCAAGRKFFGSGRRVALKSTPGRSKDDILEWFSKEVRREHTLRSKAPRQRLGQAGAKTSVDLGLGRVERSG